MLYLCDFMKAHLHIVVDVRFVPLRSIQRMMIQYDLAVAKDEICKGLKLHTFFKYI